MILYHEDIKVKCGDTLLTGAAEQKTLTMKHGIIYDIVEKLNIPEPWSWIGSSLIYKDAPENFEIVCNDEFIEFTSAFKGIASVTVNDIPSENRIYFAIEKKDGTEDFQPGDHELLIISFQLVGYRLYIEIRERC